MVKSIKEKFNKEKITRGIKRAGHSASHAAFVSGRWLWGYFERAGVLFSNRGVCPKCAHINDSYQHEFFSIKHSYNNIGLPAPKTARRLGKFKCKKCKHEFTKKSLLREYICPRCTCALTTDGSDTYYTPKLTEYHSVRVRTASGHTYPWGQVVKELHTVYECPKCHGEFWRFRSVNKKPCCPRCRALGKASYRSWVEDVSTYTKTEIIEQTQHGPRYGQVAYEQGYEIEERYCSECGDIASRVGGWYTRKL